MKKPITRFLTVTLLLLAGLLSGCVSSSTPTTKSIAMIDEEALDEHIFPKDQIIHVNIKLDEADFQQLLDNPTDEKYVQATVDYNGFLLENVGLRTKGNSSLRAVAGMSNSDRYSFKLSFDEYVTQSIGGITKINLNNEYSDASYMREFLAYEIADKMGIPTPKYSFVNVYINGELWGLYTAVEQISTSFIEREFQSTAGTLYKSNGGNGADLAALAEFDEYTGLDVKHGSANKEALLTMTDVLNNGSTSHYEDVLDVEAALKFIAFNTVTANMDSYAGNFKHNYYLYELDGVFTIIPWDLNMAFGGFGGSGILMDEPTGVSLSSRPLIAKLIAEEAYREEYHAIIQSMLDLYFSGDTFQNRVLELQALISEAVKQDPTAFVTFEQFEEGVASLISFVDTQTESISKQLTGESPSYGDGSGSGGMGGGMAFGGANRERPNGAQLPGGMQMPDGMQLPGGAQMPDGMQMPDPAQLPDGMQMPDGAQLPDGVQMPVRGNRDQGEGFGGRMAFENMNGTFSSLSSISSEQQIKHFRMTLISIALLIAGCFIVLFWRRRSL